MNQENRAVIVNLHYDPNMSTSGRTEHSVVYISFIWNELFEIFADPRTFLSWKRGRFNPAPSNRGIKPFRFKDGPTIVVDALRANVARALPLLGLFGANFRKAESQDQFESKLEELFEGVGGFIADFAVDTSLLNILYHPPKRQTVRRTLDLTPVTLAQIENSALAHLHFDLIKPEGRDYDHRDFAALAVDYLEGQEEILSTVPMERIFRTSATLVPEGGLLHHDEPRRLRPEETVKLDFYRGTAEHPVAPSLVIDGKLYDCPPEPPCWEWVCEEMNGTWYCAWVKVKDYECKPRTGSV